MARRLRLPTLSALTRAYQRNLKTLERALRPARTQAAQAVKAAAVAQKSPAAAAAARARSAQAIQGAKAVKAVKAGKGVRQAGASAALRSTAVRKAAARKSAPPGQWLAGVASGPAGARRFHLHVPPGLNLRPGEKLPLLVMLHGCGQTGQEFAQSTRMNRLAARARFLVLYPEQERMANAQGCWNWFQQRSGQADAEAATLLAAVLQVAQFHPVDLARVALAGLSAGASMAALMAARFPGHFCAVVMHSGVTPGAAQSGATALAAMRGHRSGQLPTPSARVLGSAALAAPLPPLLVLQGDADGVVAPRNGLASAQLWAQALGARAGAPRTQQRGQRHPMRVTQFKLKGRTLVELREIARLGHAWSGGAAQFSYSDPAGPDASALVWAFVARTFKPLSSATPATAPKTPRAG